MNLVKEQTLPSSFFLALFTALFLAIFYNTVTNMAGVYIVSDLGGSSEISVYPMIFFGLGSALSIPIANPLADRFGPIRVLIIGLMIYTGFSILCGLASYFFTFNCYRFGLGAASGLFYILCRRILFHFIPREKKEKYSFITVIMFAVIPVFGACFGAWVAYESHWRWIFHLNEPLSFFLMAYFWVFYRKMDPSPVSPPSPFDGIGYFFFCLGIGSLVSAAVMAQELDWVRSPIWVTLCVLGIPSTLFFILRSWAHPFPLLEIQLFKSRSLSFALFNLAILFSAYFGMIILIALWLNIYANYTPVWVAILIGIMGVASLVAFGITRVFFQAKDSRFTLLFAIFCFLVSCYYSTYFNVEVDFFHLSVARSLAGMGLVLFLFPIFKMSLTSYPEEKDASIFTLIQVVRSLASSLGAGIYVILWQRRQVFFHERLGENVTVYSQITKEYFQKAVHIFHLTEKQATEQLTIFLEKQATSLALNDVFGLMGYILLGLLVLLGFSFLFIPMYHRQK